MHSHSCVMAMAFAAIVLMATLWWLPSILSTAGCLPLCLQAWWGWNPVCGEWCTVQCWKEGFKVVWTAKWRGAAGKAGGGRDSLWEAKWDIQKPLWCLRDVLPPTAQSDRHPYPSEFMFCRVHTIAHSPGETPLAGGAVLTSIESSYTGLTERAGSNWSTAEDFHSSFSSKIWN